jgi:hypothetical protein
MKARESSSFTLTLDSLRAIGSWAADCAELALPVFEKHYVSDSRPRAAIDGIRVFAAGGKRTAQLRSLGWAAYAASREASDPAPSAAAYSACLAAASAYTHPLADVHQTKHILGPAAHAALALELDQAGNSTVGDGVVLWAIEHVTVEVRDVLQQMPTRPEREKRLDQLLFELDRGIRSRRFGQPA